MYIENESYKVGQWYVTKKEHSSLNGTFAVGSKVKITGVSERGYNIEDEFGNYMSEVGFII